MIKSAWGRTGRMFQNAWPLCGRRATTAQTQTRVTNLGLHSDAGLLNATAERLAQFALTIDRVTLGLANRRREARLRRQLP